MRSCGNWSNSADAGVFYRNLNNNRSNDNNNNGFRAADYCSIPDTTEVDTGDIGISTPASAKYESQNTNSYCFGDITLEKIADIDVLYQAFINASKGKRDKKPIYDFENNLATNLYALQRELLDKTYRPREPRCFIVQEPKPREIAAPSFRDSVVQHAVYMFVYPLFDKTFIHDSYGCRKNKGTHKAAKQTKRYMRLHSKDSYYLQIDIKKYYYSIRHAILRKHIAKKIPDSDVVDLMMLFAGRGPKGLNIGSLLSQLFGLIYLNQFDHWIKRYMRFRHYVRYVDDSVIFGFTSIDEAKAALDRIRLWLSSRLDLQLSKYKILKTKRGINFVGFRMWHSLVLLRKRSMRNFNRSLKRADADSLVSIVGNAQHTDTFKHFLTKLQQGAANDIQIQAVYRKFA